MVKSRDSAKAMEMGNIQAKKAFNSKVEAVKMGL